MAHLLQHLQPILFRNGVYRADVYQAAYPVLQAQLGDVAGPPHVDGVHGWRSLVGNVDDARGVNYHHVPAIRIGEQRLQGGPVPNIPLVIPDGTGVHRPFVGENQPPYRRARFTQHTDDSAAQMPVGAGNDIDSIHGSEAPLFTIAALIFFSVYIIIYSIPTNNKQIPDACRFFNISDKTC